MIEPAFEDNFLRLVRSGIYPLFYHKLRLTYGGGKTRVYQFVDVLCDLLRRHHIKAAPGERRGFDHAYNEAAEKWAAMKTPEYWHRAKRPAATRDRSAALDTIITKAMEGKNFHDDAA